MRDLIDRLHSRLSREDGAAMIVAAGALLVMMILVAAVQSGAITLRNSASKDRNSKRALAAANAGLSVATDRTLRIRPGNDLCLADFPVPVDSMTGECPSSTPTSLGGGATYKYTVTPVLPAGDSCRSVPTSPALTSSDLVRCITSVGTANGVTRRVQSRLVALPGFPLLGLTGLQSVRIGEEVRVYADVSGTTLGDVATNGSLTVENDAQLRYGYLSPGATASGVSTSQQKPVTARYDLPMRPFEPAENSNKNSTIPAMTGWNPATRELDLSNAQTLTLTQSGVYSFCRISLNTGSHIYVAPGVAAEIYLDSPDRDSASQDPASSCASGGSTVGTAGGTLFLSTGTSIETCQTLSPCTQGPSKNLLFYAYGRSSIQPDLWIGNGSRFNGGLYAPRSYVRVGENSVFRGAIAANRVSLSEDTVFRTDPSLGMIPSTYQSRYWTECTPQMTNPPDPESGCS
jgi:hypothetical protein